ncbi:MAG TPA: FYDLN acid domain-containing protein [Thermoanaerobaculia bacterium]|nr:FYDLN acid domain-containing protein [Thermoanaerobaculia bacterium]
MAQLGDKFECDDCGIKVYDLGRPQALCPRCGRDLKSLQPKRKVVEPAPRARPEPVVEEPAAEEPAAEETAETEVVDDDLVADDELELVEADAEDEEEEADLDDEE